MPRTPSLRRVAPLVLAVLAACTARTGPGGPRDPDGGGWQRPLGRTPEVELAPGASLAVPVRGIRPEQLRDSYHHARSGGRTHRAIDILAPEGTPVIAAADGTIFRLRQGGLGGTTLYQLDRDGRTMYYYAHLQRYAAGVREGLPVWRGQVIAYVGDTGNAGRGNYHLHFSVARVADLRRWWEGENTNPYPMLTGERPRPERSGR